MKRLHARWVLPIDAPPIHDGTVIYDDDLIHWVGPRSSAPPGAMDRDLGEAILLPGLVNAHIHLDLAALAGRVTTRDFVSWIRALVQVLGGLTPALLQRSAQWAVLDQLRHGVTTMADTAPNRHGFDALRACGARGIAYREVFGPDPAQCERAIAMLEAAVRTMRADATALVQVGVSPHAPFSVSDALYRATAELARAESLPVAVHIAESVAESAYVIAGRGPWADYLRDERAIAVEPRAASPIAVLERTGILATRPLCIHAVQADAHDIARLAASQSSVAHCPCSNAWFGHGRAPLAALRDAGIPVGLGTDSIVSNEAVRILREAAAVADEAMSPAERLALATSGGAAALGLSDRIGRLRAGFAADLAAFAIADVRACDRDPTGYVLAALRSVPALLTMVAGIDRTVTQADLDRYALPDLP